MTVAASPAPARLSRRRLSDMRIRTKLGLLLAVPAVAVLSLGGYLVSASAGQAMTAGRALLLTELAGRAGDLAFALELERAAAAIVLLPSPPRGASAAYTEAAAQTDAALVQFTQAVARARAYVVRAEMAAALSRVDGGLAGLGDLRRSVRSDAAWSVAVLRYRLLIADLLTLRVTPALAGLPARLADQVRAASALSQAVEYAGLQHIAAVRAASTDQLSPAEHRAFITAQNGFDEARQSFFDLALPSWRDHWATALTGKAVASVALMGGAVGATKVGERVRLNVAEWTRAMTTQMRLLHQVQQRVDADVYAAVQAERDGQVRAAWVTAGLVAVVLAIAVVVAARVARSMARRLRALRQGVLDVAHHELPAVVARLAEPRAIAGLTAEHVVHSATIPVYPDGRDEIADVADAFVTVSREAVRHAAEQALLRAHINEMFIAIARRLQQLTDGMMRQLDALESGETDEQRLADLFALDHLATRVGRYTESLLVVSGTVSGRQRTAPVDMLDVLRAAVGQVEDYRRVHYGVVDEGVSVLPHAVDHVVHALAELIDNACNFSAPDVPVLLESRRIGQEAFIDVVDRGIGLSPAALAELNRRLSMPPQVDVRSLRSIGIATVAAIASWHGLRVTLSPGEGGGTVARMVLPPELTVRAPRHLRAEDVPPRWPVVPRLLERPGTVVGGGLWPRTPAEIVAPASDESGWLAAAAAATPTPAGTSAAGLPVRSPMAQLVPGAYRQANGDAGHARNGHRDARAIAAAMRSYQLGLKQGRAAVRPTDTTSPDAGGSGE